MGVVQVNARSLAQMLGGEVLGDPLHQVSRIGALSGARADTVSFLANPRYQSQLAGSQAGCVIVGEPMRAAVLERSSAIVCDDPYLAFARLTQWWAAQTRPAVAAGIHPSAVVDPSASIDPSATVGPLAVVGARAFIGERVQLGAHAVLGDDARVGADSRFAAGVVLGERCVIGQRAIVHSGVVIGADGFGFAPHAGRWEKIEQLGAVRIGDDVEIGANTCIDRGALDDTVIEDGVKIDNLVQIGHNVHIGAHSALAGCAGVAGSTRIGAHCTAGGGARILGHLELADHVHISAATVVTRSIHKPGQYSGIFPFDDNASWEKNAATLRQLHAMRDRLRALEKKTK